MTKPNPTPELPEIAECTVELDGDGGFLLTHKRTRETATAATHADAVIEGIALRVIASWKSQTTPRRAGDPT